MIATKNADADFSFLSSFQLLRRLHFHQVHDSLFQMIVFGNFFIQMKKKFSFHVSRCMRNRYSVMIVVDFLESDVMIVDLIMNEHMKWDHIDWSYRRLSYMLRNIYSSYLTQKKNLLRRKFIINVMLCEVIILMSRIPRIWWEEKGWLSEILSCKWDTEKFGLLTTCYTNYRNEIPST
jgi:hypothetical protein